MFMYLNLILYLVKLLLESIRLNRLNNIYVYEQMPCPQNIRLYRMTRPNLR